MKTVKESCLGELIMSRDIHKSSKAGLPKIIESQCISSLHTTLMKKSRQNYFKTHNKLKFDYKKTVIALSISITAEKFRRYQQNSTGSGISKRHPKITHITFHHTFPF